MDDLINDLELEIGNLIRKKLGNSDIDFIGGNTLDGLIKDHIDIKYVCMRSEVLYHNLPNMVKNIMKNGENVK